MVLPSIFYKCFRKRHCEMTNKRFAMRRGGEGGKERDGRQQWEGNVMEAAKLGRDGDKEAAKNGRDGDKKGRVSCC